MVLFLKTLRTSPTKLLPWMLVRILPVATILFIAMGYMSSRLAENSFRHHFEQTLDQELRLSVSALADKLDTFKASVHAVASNSLIVNSLVDVESRHAYLPMFFNHLQIAGSPEGDIVFTDYKGRILAANKPSLRAINITPFKSVFKGREFLQINAQGLTFAVPVFYNRNSEGMIVVRYNPVQTARLLSHGSPLHAALIYKGNAILYSSSPEFSKLFKSRANRANWIERHKLVPSYSNISMVIAAPKETVLAGLYRIEKFMYAVIALSLLALSCSIFLVVFLTSRQLKHFMKQVRSFGHASDLDRRVKPSGFSEIHALGKSFNAMLQRLQQAVVSQTDLEVEITMRQTIEERLRDREEHTRAIVENVLEGIITCDDKGIIESFNPAASKIFEYDPEQVIGRNVKILMSDPDRRRHDNYIKNHNKTSRSKIIGKDREVTGLRSNGERFPMELIISPMLVGNRRMFTSVVRDITERKRVDTMKNEFVSTVSHELRTPLTALVGSLGLIEHGALGTLPEKAGKLISIASGNAKRLTTLVNDILDIQKIEAGKMEFSFEVVEMVELAHLVLSENEPYAQKHDITFRLDCDLPQAIIKADKNRMIQVFNNLLSNAAKFSAAGEEVILRIKQKGSRFEFSVIDHGTGIPDDKKKAIFEKFTQLDGSNTRQTIGTGLGLGIASAIVEIHGCEIKLESQLGKGSTFYFDLPGILANTNIPSFTNSADDIRPALAR